MTIPVELRRKFGIEEGAKVEVVEEKDGIVIKNSRAYSTLREVEPEKVT
ncbi:AbrB/MazE/SpoVT family DNA-binding domain-containing protein [Candidatus Bathyarchaeota archaeon]|nr:AbrB/MazE/SpoVT family DNA-binding domain-containing protein [Candidatus Bathyarchaeota archaeon]